MKNWVIYKHTSQESKKSYIGMTSETMERRWINHCSEAMNSSDRHFHRAIRLYGKDNWDHKILAENITSLEEAYTLEKYFIKLHKTFEEGYNLTEGGEGNPGLQLPEYFTVRTWEHYLHGEYIGTAEELIVTWGLDVTQVRGFLKGRQTSVNGWVEKGTRTPPNPRRSPSEVIELYHDAEGWFKGTIKDFSVIIGKPINHISKVLSGKHVSICGWRLTENTVPVKRSIVYVYENGELLMAYPSASEASRQLGLRTEQMSEWLNASKYKELNGKVYSYEYAAQGDKQLGMIRE